MNGVKVNENICSCCGSVVSVKREKVKTEAGERSRGLVDYLLLPVGMVAGLVISTFPLSLPLLYLVAVIFVR